LLRRCNFKQNVVGAVYDPHFSRINEIRAVIDRAYNAISTFCNHLDTGRLDATSRRSCEACLNGADEVVENVTSSEERILKHFVNPNHPVCADREAQAR
jgi:hypothetical protein